MKKVTIKSGICGFVTEVEACKLKKKEVSLKVSSTCPNVKKLIEAMDDTYDGFALCFAKPGRSPLYETAQEFLPVHAGCPVINGILKCVEAELMLALPGDASITFHD